MNATTQKRRQFFPGVQGLRGAASLAVLLYHASILLAKDKYFGQAVFGGLLGYGYRGVDLFFVISGFVMGLYVDDRSKKTPLGFAEARVRRIFIPYLPVFFGMSMLIYLIPSLFPEAYSSSDYSFIENLFILPRENLDTFVPVVAWSLAHELFFYLMVGVLLYVPLGKYVFYAWVAASAAAFFAGVTLQFPVSFLLSRYNLAFVLGIAAFFAVKRWPLDRALLPVAVGLAGLVVAMALEARSGIGKPEFFADATYFLSFAVIVFAFARIGSRALEFLGDFSYSLYLVHYPLLVACVIFYMKIVGASAPYVAFAFAVAVALIASYFYFRIFEEHSPSLRFGRVWAARTDTG